MKPKTAGIYGCSSPKVSKLGFDPSPNHDNLREDSLEGGQLEEWTKLGYQALCGYDGFNDRYADKIFDQQYLKKNCFSTAHAIV